MITSIILSYLAWFAIPIAIGFAVYAYFSIPVIGKPIAMVLICGASAYFFYELGYADRGKLDKSAQLAQQNANLQAQLVEAQRQAEATKQIADDASKREIDATASATEANAKVAEYEKELSIAADTAGTVPEPSIPEVHRAGNCTNTIVKVSACGLSARDVERLRGLGSP